MRRSGFTILELIAVIGIIAVIGTAVIGGFSGMMKGVARRSAIDSVRRALNLARQEACVDGNDTYLYPVDVNRYAIVRKAGTITGTGTGSRKVTLEGVSAFQTSIDGGKWILDEFADLSGSTETFVVDQNLSQADLIEKLKDYGGSLVFDMKDGVYTTVAFSPFRDKDNDVWVFGIHGTTSFDKGHDYGWVTHPIQSLPAGYVFKGSYNTSDGSYKSKHGICVHFLPDGTAEKAVTLTLQRPEDGSEIPLKIEVSGKISEGN
jgi:prepilin-type N-terminal cleavage/methylation domain-containing protein